jgi:hypothetical protein
MTTYTSLRFPLLLTAVFTSACATNPADDETLSGAPGKGDSGYGEEEPVSSLEARCKSDGTLDVRVSGSGLSAYEGKTVWVSAIEDSQRRVLVSGEIKNGSVVVSCANSIDENYRYPSWAAFIDADGDGECSAGDVGTQMILYGWAWNLVESFSAAELGATSDLAPYLHANGQDFCAAYF